MFVATAYRSMLNSWSGIDDIKNKLSSMRVWSAGGMPMPVKTEIEWKKMTGKYIYMAYGLTESTSPLTLWDYPYNGELKIYKDIVSSGRPVYYTTIKGAGW
ncbi:AMP-binding protein [Acidiplasma cupricumulans]|uniref:AMP-binding protein n=1 Tax=Acidiplasma cupricumulans TaxID=312540 RepID=UPI000783FD36|nr:AMP-binding protein [Acidiplasma cupricumulans]